ncbi:hypothetical protein CTRI78_v000939 [Colletotrichum trifolii]|uniref:Uncharacterized protein n=1 Tax=Colletotrichum trifolii TaxID=5466 RepID=A0A4R8RU22_COLTR|nr:hypothetical protein CTRI78_v000939 [Colletotrichum trifolii]
MWEVDSTVAPWNQDGGSEQSKEGRDDGVKQETFGALAAVAAALFPGLPKNDVLCQLAYHTSSTGTVSSALGGAPLATAAVMHMCIHNRSVGADPSSSPGTASKPEEWLFLRHFAFLSFNYSCSTCLVSAAWQVRLVPMVIGILRICIRRYGSKPSSPSLPIRELCPNGRDEVANG